MSSFGLPRAPEFTTSFTHCLRFSDVICQSNRLISSFRRAKSDQFGQGTLVTLRASKIPVAQLELSVPLRSSENAPVFSKVRCSCFPVDMRTPERSSYGHQDTRIIKSDASKIRTHSFRIGAACSAAQLRKSPVSIRKFGR